MRRKNAGFSLIETLVALSLLAVAMLLTLSLIFQEPFFRDIPDADLAPVQQMAAAAATNAAQLVGKSPGEVIRAEHVMQALFHDIGLTDDEVDLRVDPLRAALIG